MRKSISRSKNDFEGIRPHNPTKLLCLSPKIKCTREIASLTGSSSHEELNHPGTFWRKTCNPYRGITLLCITPQHNWRELYRKVNGCISFQSCQILSPSKTGNIVSANTLTNIITLLTVIAALWLQGETPTYILNKTRTNNL